MTEALLEIRDVSKSFCGNTALDRVSLEVRGGEVVALLGHNGSGKSTLVKVLSGHYTCDEGAILRGPSGNSGLHFIHQNLGLVDDLSVTENLDISAKRKWWGLGPIDRRMDRRRTMALLQTFRVPIDPDAKIASLTPAERTIVAIVRALDGWQGADHVLVLDEPTAALHGEEVEILKDAVRAIASRGAGIIYITHRLAEAVELADRAIVLRNGRVVAEQARGEFDYSSLIRAITGAASLPHDVRQQDASKTTSIFSVRHLRGKSLSDINLNAEQGEIIGITGVVGSGMEQLNGTIFGVVSRQSGAVMLEGQAVRADDPTASIRAGSPMCLPTGARMAASDSSAPWRTSRCRNSSTCGTHGA